MANNIVAQMQVLISAQTKGLNTALGQSTSALKSFEGAIGKTNKILGAFGVGIGAAALVNLGSQIVDITAKFERFGAILANTLGSQSAAQKALDSIRQFAVSTPFEVSEVTAAYVRWANQGLNPTIDKMGKLGDVASSLGAGFEQTAEAFKDLLVGQTKRIEEIGISAQQSNGKIQLSFKGVNLEIEKNVAGVEKALEVYSSLNGVQGTSQIIAETLGGKISNLKDSWGNLLLTIGSGNSGILSKAVDLMIALTTATNDLLESFTNVDKAELKQFTKNLAETVKDDSVLIKDMVNKLSILRNSLDTPIDITFAKQIAKEFELSKEQTDRFLKIIAEINGVEVKPVVAVVPPVPVETIESLEALRAKQKELNDQFATTDINDKKQLANIGQKILAINAQIDALENFRKKQAEVQTLSTQFAKDQLKNATLGIKTEVDIEPTAVENILPTTIPVPDIAPAMAALEEYTEAIKVAGAGAIESYDQMRLAQEQQIESQQRQTQAAINFGAAVGDSIAEAINAEMSFVDTVKHVTKKLLILFLQQALAAAISKSMQTAKNPFVGLALAAATSAAVGLLFRAKTGHSGGGGGGPQSNLTNVSRFSPTQPQSQEPQQFEFVLHGNDLVANQTTQLNRNLRLGR